MTAPLVPGAIVPFTVPPDVRELATLQRVAETDARAMAALAVTDAGELAFADALLTDVVTRRDAAIAMRKRVTGPAYAIAREVEGWFRPFMVALDACESHLKGAIGAYRLEQRRLADEARELAAVAADTGDADGLVTALTVAADAGAKDGARATTRYVWAVVRVIPDLLMDEWWTPDMARIEAAAKAAPGDADAPVIPGVLFERRAVVGARR